MPTSQEAKANELLTAQQEKGEHHHFTHARPIAQDYGDRVGAEVQGNSIQALEYGSGQGSPLALRIPKQDALA